jgi:hypothetical protein
VNATVYYDSTDQMIDEQIAKIHFDGFLKRHGYVADITMKADVRLTGRKPLLVIDGGKLDTCPTS